MREREEATSVKKLQGRRPRFLAKQVFVPKDKRVIPGSMERGIHYLAATGALKQTFGLARHFFPTSREG